MKILSLQAENIKRIKAVEITPQSAIVQITGKNMQGKSSVLDAIEMALGGGKMPKAPIRKGATTAKISLDLGTIKVTRKFTETATTLVVESDKGARFPSPQRMLDDLIGAISFDPLGFARMEPKAQFDTLRKVASVDVDIEALAGKNAHDYEERTAANKEAKAARIQADAIILPEGLADKPADLDALLSQMQDAARLNGEIETRRANRESVANKVAALRAEADQMEAKAKETRDKAAELEEKLATAEALPEPLDVDALRKAIDEARATNTALQSRKRKDELVGTAERAEEKAKALTEAIEARDKAKADAIAAAKMPIPDITLGDGQVIYKGLPFDQASSAEQLRVSVSIAMAANPELRVLRIKEGGLLDEDGMKLLTEMAETGDYQVWIETVVANGPVTVEMVDGMAKAPEPAKEGEGDAKLL